MVGFRILIVAALLSALFVGATHRARADSRPLTLAAMLGYPFQSDLAAAPRGDTIAWVRNVRGVRNVWMARGPDFTPRQVTHFEGDEGQELTQLTFSPDGAHLVWVRGGDHDANWPAEGGLAPDPASTVESPTVTIWSASAPAWTPTKVADGDGPAISARGVLAFVRDRQVWTAPIGGKGATERLFFDRGHDEQLAWSPGGDRLVFVSERGDHAFVGVFTAKDQPLIWLAPSTSKDESPRWSPDGGRIAFTRRPGDGGAPEPLLTETPEPGRSGSPMPPRAPAPPCGARRPRSRARIPRSKAAPTSPGRRAIASCSWRRSTTGHTFTRWRPAAVNPFS
jgi:hypothetical protein